MLRLKLYRQFLKVETINVHTLTRFRCVFLESDKRAERPNNEEIDNYKLQFNDGRLSTETKSISDILRALVILKLCTIDTIVDNSEKVGTVLYIIQIIC
jgi:hypothetical protein